MHIVIGLLIAFALVAVYHLSTRITRQCRWRADRSKDTDGRHYYYCAACGAEALHASDRPPRVCGAGR